MDCESSDGSKLQGKSCCGQPKAAEEGDVWDPGAENEAIARKVGRGSNGKEKILQEVLEYISAC